MKKTNIAKARNRSHPADVDFPSAIAAFRTFNKSRNLSPRTIQYYDGCLLSFTRYLEAHYPATRPSEVTVQILRQFLIHEAERNSASTASHCHCTLNVFFGFLVTDGILVKSPMAGIVKPKRRTTVIETFSTQQIADLLKTCKNDFIGLRDIAMILVMLDCGLRVSELVGMSLEDISWEERTLKVLGKGDKERVIPFGNTAETALHRYISRRGKLGNSRLFVNCYGEAISRYSVRELIARKGDAAGISGVRCSPHTFRHTFAVMYLRNGGDTFSLQKLLGHSDLAMTRKYAELSQTDVQDKHRLYSPADRLDLPGKSKSGLK